MLSGKNENGINYYTARKLKDMAQSLEQLAKAFDEGAGETMSLTKDDGLAAMQTCAALVCGNCGGCSLYADSEKEDSYYLYYLLRIFEQNGRIGTEDMPELFKKDCRRKRDYLEQLKKHFAGIISWWIVCFCWNMKAGAGRSILRQRPQTDDVLLPRMRQS